MLAMTANPPRTRRSFLRAAIAAAATPPEAWSKIAMAASAMITRPIPSSGEAMPVIGLGTSQVFDVGAEERARQPLREVLRLMLDAGGRMIDTSPMYGRAEAVTGDLVAGMEARPRVFLATKVWTSGREAGLAQMRRSA